MKIDIVESDHPSVQLGIMAELEILRILRLQGFRSEYTHIICVNRQTFYSGKKYSSGGYLLTACRSLGCKQDSSIKGIHVVHQSGESHGVQGSIVSSYRAGWRSGCASTRLVRRTAP